MMKRIYNNNQCVCDACGQLTIKYDDLYSTMTGTYLCANCVYQTMEIVDSIMVSNVVKEEEDMQGARQ